MATITSTPSTEISSSTTEFINGKIIVTETKVLEFDPNYILEDLRQKKADQIIQKQKAIEANDNIIASYDLQIAEIEKQIGL